MTIKQIVLEAFEQRFGTHPDLLVRAPGRVNLIGEHTDYNEGFVLPMAIERAVWIALRPRLDQQVTVHALDFDETASFSFKEIRHTQKGWVEYIKGMAWAMQSARYKLNGWEGVMAGDIPIGAGLSSSAAIEMAAGRAFASVSDLSWNASAFARLGQQAESEWVGLRCGIMDQMASAASRAGHAFLLDCRSLNFEHIPLPARMAIIALDTKTRRNLVDSAYNQRRLECQSAARALGVTALRDINMEDFISRCGELEDTLCKRARHVITENARVQQAARAMREGDVTLLCKRINESHASLRDDFEVSGQALDEIVDWALQQPGCFGARMTGAGFGGCAIAIVEAGHAQAFIKNLASHHPRENGRKPEGIICEPGEGASLESF